MKMDADIFVVTSLNRINSTLMFETRIPCPINRDVVARAVRDLWAVPGAIMVQVLVYGPAGDALSYDFDRPEGQALQ
jgi:hypothetical protein